LIEDRSKNDQVFVNIFTNEKYEFSSLKIVLLETIYQIMIESEVKKIDFEAIDQELFRRVNK